MQSIDVSVGVDASRMPGQPLGVCRPFCQGDSIAALAQCVRGRHLPDSGVENAGRKRIGGRFRGKTDLDDAGWGPAVVDRKQIYLGQSGWTWRQDILIYSAGDEDAGGIAGSNFKRRRPPVI